MGKSDQVLSGLRIVELGTDVAAANTGRLLAAYGADVITVEPPTGHPIRYLPPWAEADDTESAEHDPHTSILFAYLGTSTPSITRDLKHQRMCRLLRPSCSIPTRSLTVTDQENWLV